MFGCNKSQRSKVTYEWVDLCLGELDEALENPDSKVAEHLSIFREVKVPEILLILLGSVARLEDLMSLNCNCVNYFNY